MNAGQGIWTRPLVGARYTLEKSQNRLYAEDTCQMPPKCTMIVCLVLRRNRGRLIADADKAYIFGIILDIALPREQNNTDTTTRMIEDFRKR